jgi:hypothetical protein
MPSKRAATASLESRNKIEQVLSEIAHEAAYALGPVVDDPQNRFDEEIKALVVAFGMEAVVKQCMSRAHASLVDHGMTPLWEGNISLHDIIGNSLEEAETHKGDHFRFYRTQKGK